MLRFDAASDSEDVISYDRDTMRLSQVPHPLCLINFLGPIVESRRLKRHCTARSHNSKIYPRIPGRGCWQCRTFLCSVTASGNVSGSQPPDGTGCAQPPDVVSPTLTQTVFGAWVQSAADVHGTPKNPTHWLASGIQSASTTHSGGAPPVPELPPLDAPAPLVPPFPPVPPLGAPAPGIPLPPPLPPPALAEPLVPAVPPFAAPALAPPAPAPAPGAPPMPRLLRRKFQRSHCRYGLPRRRPSCPRWFRHRH